MDKIVKIKYDHLSLKAEITVDGKIFDTSRIDGKKIEDWIYPFLLRKVKWNGIFDELKMFLDNDKYTIEFSGDDSAFSMLLDECPETVSIVMKKKRGRSESVVGIDLGTSNSKISVLKKGKIINIADKNGNTIFPSVISFDSSGDALFFSAARSYAATDPENACLRFKEGTGKKYTGGGKEYTQQEIISMYINRLKEITEEYLDEYVESAVISIPSSFTHIQIKMLRDAFKQAGLKVIRTLTDCTAAAYAYAIENNFYEGKMLICNIGSGNFDIALTETGDSVCEVLSSESNDQICGNQFDQRIVDWIAVNYLGAEGVNIKNDPILAARVQEAAERAKIELSCRSSCNIDIPDLAGTNSLNVRLTSEMFDILIDDLVGKMISNIKKVLRESGVNISDIDNIMLIGGGAKIPFIQNSIKEFAGDIPVDADHPLEYTSMGLAYLGEVIHGSCENRVLLMDVLASSLKINDEIVLLKNASVPIRGSHIIEFGRAGKRSINISQYRKNIFDEDALIVDFDYNKTQSGECVEIIYEIDAAGKLTISFKSLPDGEVFDLIRDLNLK